MVDIGQFDNRLMPLVGDISVIELYLTRLSETVIEGTERQHMDLYHDEELQEKVREFSEYLFSYYERLDNADGF